MKTTIKFILPFVLILFVVFSCDLFGGDNLDNVKDIGGDTDLPENKVGSVIKGRGSIGDKIINTDAQLEVIKNEDGIITVRATGTIPAELKKYKSLIPQEFLKFVDSNDKVSADFRFKNSTNGVAYVDSKGKQSVITKYDLKEGDSWTQKTSNGDVFKRKVIHRSTTNDFQYRFFKIKVITIEQTLPYPGFSKVVYMSNHKFGIVQADIYLEDGTKMSIWNTN